MKNIITKYNQIELILVVILACLYSQHIYAQTQEQVQSNILVSQEDESPNSFSSMSKDFVMSTLIQNGSGGISGLGGAVNIEISKNGKDVYVAGHTEDTLTVFKFQNDSKGLLFHSYLRNNTENIEGLSGIWDIAISNDGRDVYATGYNDDAIVYFRNDNKEKITYIATYYNGRQGIVGLNGPRELVLSPDGKNLYVVSELDNSLVSFGRNPISGLLSYQSTMTDGYLGVDGLLGARGITINKQGDKIYVAGYRDNSLVEFIRNTNTGSLSIAKILKNSVDNVKGIAGASTVALSSDEKIIFVTGFTYGTLALFSYDTEGILVFSKVFRNGVDGISGLQQAYKVVSATDSPKVYVSSYGDNAISEFGYKKTKDGEEFTQISVFKNKVANIDSLEGAWGVAIHPTGVVYVTGFKSHTLASFAVNENTGLMDYQGSLYNKTGTVGGLDGAISISLSPDDKNIYVSGMFNNEVGVFTWDASNTLLFSSSVEEEFDKDTKSSDGNTSLNISSGQTKGIWDLETSSDGKNVYAIRYSDNALMTFARNSLDGSLKHINTIKNGEAMVHGIEGAYDLAISHDGKNVYVTGYKDDAIAIFDRDEEGTLTFKQSIYDNVGDVDGLDGAYMIAISQDDSSVYVTGFFDDALVVFDRNTDGTITFKQKFSKNINTTGLDGAFGVSLNSSNTLVYVTGNTNGTLTVFKRNQDGSLEYSGIVKNNVDGVFGLDEARSIVVSPDEQFLFITTSKGVVILKNLPNTDIPIFYTLFQDKSENVTGLNGAWGIKVSHDNTKIYVVSYHDDSLSIFTRSF